MPTAPGVPPSAGLERDYAARIRREIVEPVIRSIRSRVERARRDYESIRQAIHDARAEAPGGEGAWVGRSLSAVEADQRARFQRAMRRHFGVQVDLMGPDDVRYMVERAVIENVDLIRTIPPRLHESLQRDFLRLAGSRPFDERSVLRVLGRGYRSSNWNARRIARDQTSKLVGRLAQHRQQQLGIERYRWSTSGDERVRPDHRAVSGEVFAWEGDPAPPGDLTRPGFPPLCRCVGVPVWTRRPSAAPVSALPAPAAPPPAPRTSAAPEAVTRRWRLPELDVERVSRLAESAATSSWGVQLGTFASVSDEARYLAVKLRGRQVPGAASADEWRDLGRASVWLDADTVDDARSAVSGSAARQYGPSHATGIRTAPGRGSTAEAVELKPTAGAHIVDEADLVRDRAEFVVAARGRGDERFRALLDAAAGDLGHYAQLRGVDAIRLDDGSLVVVNMRAMLVDRRTRVRLGGYDPAEVRGALDRGYAEIAEAERSTGYVRQSLRAEDDVEVVPLGELAAAADAARRVGERARRLARTVTGYVERARTAEGIRRVRSKIDVPASAPAAHRRGALAVAEAVDPLLADRLNVGTVTAARGTRGSAAWGRRRRPADSARRVGDRSTAVLARDADMRSAAHELGHALEYADPELFRDAVRFLQQYRASDAAPFDGARRVELNRLNSHEARYVGKFYRQGGVDANTAAVRWGAGETQVGGTEVVSSAMEFWARDPARFILDYPELSRWFVEKILLPDWTR